MSLEQQLDQLKTKFSGTVTAVEIDHVGCPVVWVSLSGVIELLRFLKTSDGYEYIFLSDVTAYDEHGLSEEKAGRFVVVYNLFSPQHRHRIRVKTRVTEGVEVPSATTVWPAANWPEREIFDMFGIRFSGHPDLRRILMDQRWIGHPLRKDYPLRAYQVFQDPEPIPQDLLKPTPDEMTSAEESDEVFDDARTYLNIGPSHPATHGTLRVMVRLNGETVEKSISEMGYLHRGKEKIAESITYHKFIPHTDRMNYCSSLCNNMAYVMACEKMLGIEVPERTKFIRTIAIEMARVMDHIVCVGINGVDFGAMTPFLYAFHAREEAYTIIEKLTGARLTTSYGRIGGLAAEPPSDFLPMVKDWAVKAREFIEMMGSLLTTNKIWIVRTQGVCPFTREQALAYSFTGPCARASNVNIDLRRDQPDPLLKYDAVEFDVPLGKNGDIYDRYLVRMEEMRQSLSIIQQLCGKCPTDGPIWVEDKRVRIPDKQRVYTSMEALIHHFKFFMEGFDMPAGEGYSQLEGPNGELGFYIVSKGGPKPWRTRVRAPSFYMYQGLDPMVKGSMIADLIGALGSINIIAGELDR